jgi:hypothetical protein
VLDPADRDSDPTAEIEFRPERVQRRERWRPHGLTDRGRTTIEVCDLDRPSLLTLYTEHVAHHVRPRISDLLAVHRKGNAPAVVRVWRSLLAPARPFRALSCDALRALVPAEVCARYHLVLLRPEPGR